TRLWVKVSQTSTRPSAVPRNNKFDERSTAMQVTLLAGAESTVPAATSTNSMLSKVMATQELGPETSTVLGGPDNFIVDSLWQRSCIRPGPRFGSCRADCSPGSSSVARSQVINDPSEDTETTCPLSITVTLDTSFL